MLFLRLLAEGSASPSPAAKGGGAAFQLVFFALIIGGLYMFMIRPQKARQRAQVQLIGSIEVGDEVETSAGMFGRVQRATDTIVWVELAPGMTVKMSRAAIRRRVIEPDPGQG